MATFSEEFKKYQKQERLLTGGIVLVSVLAPVSFTYLMEQKITWAISGLVALAFVATASYMHYVRAQVSQKLLSKYEKLEVGSVLAKKISTTRPHRFVITNRGFNHYYLKCLKTGEQVLVSKDRVREDFDIAN